MSFGYGYTNVPTASYLLILGHRDALAWVLTNGRMAFGDRSVAQARRLQVGDELLIYTTRGCFKNPTRDRGRVIGLATVQTEPVLASAPVEVGGRTFRTSATSVWRVWQR